MYDMHTQALTHLSGRPGKESAYITKKLDKIP